MKILINEANKEELEKILQEMHGTRAKNHLIEYDDLLQAHKIACEHSNQLLKKHCKGLSYTYCTNHKKAKAYKYSYEADCITLRWTPKGWALTSAGRRTYWPDQRDRTHFSWGGYDSEKHAELYKEVGLHLLVQFLGHK